MDLVSGYPFWLIKDGLPFQYPALQNNITTDIAIIGGGISGALMAYYLVKSGVECVIVDGRTIGLGSTCASTSLLQYEIDTPLSELKNKIGIENAIRSYKLCEASIKKLESITDDIKFADFQLVPSLYYAAKKRDEKFLKKEFDARHGAGFDVQYLPEDVVKKDYGFKAAAILSASGAQTNAYGLTHALHQYSIKKGIRIYDRTKVEKIDNNINNVTLHTNNKNTITAKKIVFANGYEAVNYFDKKIVDLHSTYAIVSEQMNMQQSFWKDECVIWNTDDPYLYLRVTNDRRIIIGGRDESFSNATRRDKLLTEKTIQLEKDFNKLLPQIKFKTEFNWTGTFGSTKDGLPYIGPYKKIKNSFFSLGFGGNGITFSVIAAEIITALITKNKSADSELFSFERS